MLRNRCATLRPLPLPQGAPHFTSAFDNAETSFSFQGDQGPRGPLSGGGSLVMGRRGIFRSGKPFGPAPPPGLGNDAAPGGPGALGPLSSAAQKGHPAFLAPANRSGTLGWSWGYSNNTQVPATSVAGSTAAAKATKGLLHSESFCCSCSSGCSSTLREQQQGEGRDPSRGKDTRGPSCRGAPSAFHVNHRQGPVAPTKGPPRCAVARDTTVRIGAKGFGGERGPVRPSDIGGGPRSQTLQRSLSMGEAAFKSHAPSGIRKGIPAAAAAGAAVAAGPKPGQEDLRKELLRVRAQQEALQQQKRALLLQANAEGRKATASRQIAAATAARKSRHHESGQQQQQHLRQQLQHAACPSSQGLPPQPRGGEGPLKHPMMGRQLHSIQQHVRPGTPCCSYNRQMSNYATTTAAAATSSGAAAAADDDAAAAGAPLYPPAFVSSEDTTAHGSTAEGPSAPDEAADPWGPQVRAVNEHQGPKGMEPVAPASAIGPHGREGRPGENAMELKGRDSPPREETQQQQQQQQQQELHERAGAAEAQLVMQMLGQAVSACSCTPAERQQLQQLLQRLDALNGEPRQHPGGPPAAGEVPVGAEGAIAPVEARAAAEGPPRAPTSASEGGPSMVRRPPSLPGSDEEMRGPFGPPAVTHLVHVAVHGAPTATEGPPQEMEAPEGRGHQQGPSRERSEGGPLRCLLPSVCRQAEMQQCHCLCPPLSCEAPPAVGAHPAAAAAAPAAAAAATGAAVGGGACYGCLLKETAVPCRCWLQGCPGISAASSLNPYSISADAARPLSCCNGPCCWRTASGAAGCCTLACPQWGFCRPPGGPGIDGGVPICSCSYTTWQPHEAPNPHMAAVHGYSCWEHQQRPLLLQHPSWVSCSINSSSSSSCGCGAQPPAGAGDGAHGGLTGCCSFGECDFPGAPQEGGPSFGSTATASGGSQLGDRALAPGPSDAGRRRKQPQPQQEGPLMRHPSTKDLLRLQYNPSAATCASLYTSSGSSNNNSIHGSSNSSSSIHVVESLGQRIAAIAAPVKRMLARRAETDPYADPLR